MSWFKYSNGKVNFPLWPRFDAWLEDNERAVIQWAIIIALAVGSAALTVSQL